MIIKLKNTSLRLDSTSHILEPKIRNLDKAIGIKNLHVVLAASHTFVYFDNNADFISTYRFERHFKVETVLYKFLNFIVFMLKTETLFLGDRYVSVFHQLEAYSVIVWVLLFIKIERKKNEHLTIVTEFYEVRF